MAYKVNPLSFRLGISRSSKTTNNIYLVNYNFFLNEYFKYEKFLFLFFYKFKFWVVSSKLMFLLSHTLLIFCNYYRLRPYFNNKPVRKKKKLRFDPDGPLRRFTFLHFFDRIFFKNSVLKYTKLVSNRKMLYINKNISKQTFNFYKHYNSSLYKIGRFIRRKNKRDGYTTLLNHDNLESNILANFIRLNTVNFNKRFANLKSKKSKKSKFKFKKLVNISLYSLIRKNLSYHTSQLAMVRLFYQYPRSCKKFIKKILAKKDSNFNINFLKISKDQIFYKKKVKIKKSKNKKVIYHLKNLHYTTKQISVFKNRLLKKNLKQFFVEDKGLFLVPRNLKYFLNVDRLYMFHLKRFLKCVFLKKNVVLKLRNIETLLPYKVYRWEDALRTAFLLQYKKKHFIRTIFRDFSYLNKIAYIEMDAQLFAKIIINMFEMTKFHRRLIYLLRDVFYTLKKFYTHIICKVKMKGKMQYKRRTKTVYIFKESVIPLNRLFILVEFGKGPAYTPFGVLGIKTWLYYSVNKALAEKSMPVYW